MFRIEAFVEDKRLAEVLRTLAGKVRGQPAVTPVANVTKALKAKTNGRLVEMFTHHLATNKIAKFKAADVKTYLESVGMSGNSYGYLINKVKTAKLIKATGKGTAIVYNVVTTKRG